MTSLENMYASSYAVSIAESESEPDFTELEGRWKRSLKISTHNVINRNRSSMYAHEATTPPSNSTSANSGYFDKIKKFDCFDTIKKQEGSSLTHVPIKIIKKSAGAGKIPRTYMSNKRCYECENCTTCINVLQFAQQGLPPMAS